MNLERAAGYQFARKLRLLGRVFEAIKPALINGI
jgi:hypothetical protein